MFNEIGNTADGKNQNQMALSNTWDMCDNIYINNIVDKSESSIYNDGIMGIFEKLHDGKVNRRVAVYDKKHGRKEGLLFNNRLLFGMLNPSEVSKAQYNTNRDYILKNILV